jgi:hypothetical protein
VTVSVTGPGCLPKQQHVDHRPAGNQQCADRDHNRPSNRDREQASLEVLCDPNVAAHGVDEGQSPKADEPNSGDDGNDSIASGSQPFQQDAQTDQAQRRPHPREKRPLVRQMVAGRALLVFNDIEGHWPTPYHTSHPVWRPGMLGQ